MTTEQGAERFDVEMREADVRSLLADFWVFLVGSGVADDELDINYRGGLLGDYQRRLPNAHFPNPSEAEVDCAEDGESWPCAIARAALSPATPTLDMEPSLREAVLLAAEEVDNTWTDEGDHIEWDADELPERLMALRRAYGAYLDAERARLRENQHD